MPLNQCPLAIAPINWSNDDDPRLGAEITFDQCIEEMQQAGFSGTELGTKFPKEAARLKQALSAKQLSLSSAWFSSFFTSPSSSDYDNTIENFVTHMSFLRAVGADVVNVCECHDAITQGDEPLFGQTKPNLTQLQWHRLAQGLNTIGDIAHRFNIKLSYHFHLGTAVETRAEIDRLMDLTNPTYVGLLLDTGHAYAADAKPLELIARYGERINQVHLKDIRMPVLNLMRQGHHSFMDGVKQGLFTVPGDGQLNFSEIFSRLEDFDYHGWLVVEAEQDPQKAPPLQYAKMAKHHIDTIRT